MKINTTPLDVNSRGSLLATIFLATVGAAVFIVQPGFVQGLVGFYGLSEQAAGYIASAEVWGIALTTLVLALGDTNTAGNASCAGRCCCLWRGTCCRSRRTRPSGSHGGVSLPVSAPVV
ncbi:hypothetical protein [Kineobactrum salinum]|uniref:Uncharacterized protein n=1 Tax=Kineobactrum salinum TaxID=2708301 RepID=A0A6C0TYJ6_9GAMM|nr:hypothetical protein [Kineobactrum salinum]QIB64613.1 hypothetical protein G3T16_03565 [Kineobactrum salinum]